MRLTSIEIIKTLRSAGFVAYWAGGCVRDMLLGIRPKDFDIATSARPDDLKKLLTKIHPVGEKYGVVIAEQKGHHFEIATFRSDSGYSDGRRPDAVLFTNPKEDALRRDFTINALFYDPLSDKVYDYVGGQEDLKNKLIRFIGAPHDRILEDHLRIIRAVRFKNTFGFQYHPQTYKALKTHAKLSKKVSGERLRDELNKMIMHSSRPSRSEAKQLMRPSGATTFPEALCDMEDTGVLAEVLPEIQAMKGVAQPPEFHTEGDVFEHTLRSLRALKPEASFILRWAVFLHDVGKPDTFKIAERIRFDEHSERSAELTGKILLRLKFSVKDMKIIQWLVLHHMMVYNVLEMSVGRRRHWFLNPWYLDLLEVNRCDIAGTIPADYKTYEKVFALYRKDMKALPREPKRLLTGHDIMKILGIPSGPKVKEILNELRLLQLERKLLTKAAAKKWLLERRW